jgi:hypothetical protein
MARFEGTSSDILQHQDLVSNATGVIGVSADEEGMGLQAVAREHERR